MVSEILVNSGSGYGLVQVMLCYLTHQAITRTCVDAKSMLPFDTLVDGDNMFWVSYFKLKQALICIYIYIYIGKQTHLLYVYGIHLW